MTIPTRGQIKSGEVKLGESAGLLEDTYPGAKRIRLPSAESMRGVGIPDCEAFGPLLEVIDHDRRGSEYGNGRSNYFDFYYRKGDSPQVFWSRTSAQTLIRQLREFKRHGSPYLRHVWLDAIEKDDGGYVLSFLTEDK